MTQRKHQREEFVRNTFDRIAWRYDLLNRIISFRLDKLWRQKAVQALRLKGGSAVVLDLGTGTGDLALAAAKEMEGQGRILGLDLSFTMLRLAQAKKAAVAYGARISYILGSALEAPFKPAAFDAIMTAFVLRNVSDLNLFFLQAHHLLKPGGRFVSLDMFPPSGRTFAFFYSLYFHRLMPWIAAGVSHDRRAYQYLSDSVKNFQPPEVIEQILRKSGFQNARTDKFLHGAVCLHSAEKADGARVPAP